MKTNTGFSASAHVAAARAHATSLKMPIDSARDVLWRLENEQRKAQEFAAVMELAARSARSFASLGQKERALYFHEDTPGRQLDPLPRLYHIDDWADRNVPQTAVKRVWNAIELERQDDMAVVVRRYLVQPDELTAIRSGSGPIFAIEKVVVEANPEACCEPEPGV